MPLQVSATEELVTALRDVMETSVGAYSGMEMLYFSPGAASKASVFENDIWVPSVAKTVNLKPLGYSPEGMHSLSVLPNSAPLSGAASERKSRPPMVSPSKAATLMRLILRLLTFERGGVATNSNRENRGRRTTVLEGVSPEKMSAEGSKLLSETTWRCGKRISPVSASKASAGNTAV